MNRSFHPCAVSATVLSFFLRQNQGAAGDGLGDSVFTASVLSPPAASVPASFHRQLVRPAKDDLGFVVMRGDLPVTPSGP